MIKTSTQKVLSPVFYQARLPLVFFGLLRLIFWGGSFPNPDEAYYWLWGQHLDWSYYDHPPIHAWIQGLFTAIFGRSVWVMRLPNLLSNALLIFTYYRINQYLYGQQSRHSFWLFIALLLGSPLYFLFLALSWNDHLLITFCLISGYQLVRFLDGYLKDGYGESWRLYGVAIALGLASLCKYSVIFVDLSCLVVVVAHPKLRSLLQDRRFYIALSILVVALLPIVAWNTLNDFQSFRYYLDRTTDPSIVKANLNIKPMELLSFLLVSAVFLSPAHCWTIRQIFLSQYWRRLPTFYSRLAGWTFALPTLSLMAIALSSTALYYWNIIAYSMLMALLPLAYVPKLSHLSPSSNQPPRFHNPALFWGGQLYGLFFALLIVLTFPVKFG